MARIEKLEDVTYVDRLRKKFSLMTRRDAATGCLEWQGSLANKGYGMIGITGKHDQGERYKYLTHRVAWMLGTGEMPPADLMVCHRCDNPACVAIEHLFLGTNADNVRDMHEKGRAAKIDPVIRRGDLNGRAKLTWDDVDAIRAEAAKGEYGIQTKLAKRYGLTQSAVNLIIKGKTWKREE
ncbi:HNH endonuclease signature motif containing protein [Deinococcus fonticola]|uniref:HNH endonuclease signature motif containing protein n=1 Tax=Deinococcus fonticola TaxID=2528713 RepID=UPI001074B0B5|nr:HNH endonuclease signature motif containing protein [Deinococcus fonticola]